VGSAVHAPGTLGVFSHRTSPRAASLARNEHCNTLQHTAAPYNTLQHTASSSPTAAASSAPWLSPPTHPTHTAPTSTLSLATPTHPSSLAPTSPPLLFTPTNPTPTAPTSTPSLLLPTPTNQPMQSLPGAAALTATPPPSTPPSTLSHSVPTPNYASAQPLPGAFAAPVSTPLPPAATATAAAARLDTPESTSVHMQNKHPNILQHTAFSLQHTANTLQHAESSERESTPAHMRSVTIVRVPPVHGATLSGIGIQFTRPNPDGLASGPCVISGIKPEVHIYVYMYVCMYIYIC